MDHIAAPSVAFIFDCDGTLVNSSPVWGHAQTELLCRHGIDVTVDDFAQFEHLSLEDECQAYHDTWGIGANGEEVYRELGEILIDGYSKVPPREGLLAFLEQAKAAGIAMCVATSTPAELVQSALAGAGLDAYMEFVTTTGEAGRSKQFPDVYELALRRVEEGAVLPTTAIRTQENLVKLHKRGRMLVASYEAIRFQRLDLFSVTLRQIGAYIARMHLDDAVQVLMNGDGNNNAADAYEIGSGSGKISGTAGTLTYSALLEFWSKFDPYSMNTMLVSNDVMLQMLKLSEFQNPLTGLNFQGTGTLSTPLGAKLLRTSAVPAGKLIGLDKNYALEHICGSEVMVEYDKLIDRQIERAAITSISGFAKPYQEASKVLTV